MIGHMGSHEWRSDYHPADRINELEQANINLSNRHCADLDRIKVLDDALKCITIYALNDMAGSEIDSILKKAYRALNKNHTLWKTGEEGCPSAIQDWNGEVVLGLCKVCGKGECELVEPCAALKKEKP
jgi:hypothetical protein